MRPRTLAASLEFVLYSKMLNVPKIPLPLAAQARVLVQTAVDAEADAEATPAPRPTKRARIGRDGSFVVMWPHIEMTCE
jgi:hypothetical protein